MDALDLTKKQDLSCELNTSNLNIIGYRLELMDGKNNTIFAPKDFTYLDDKTLQGYGNTGYNGSVLRVPFVVTDINKMNKNTILFTNYKWNYWKPTYEVAIESSNYYYDGDQYIRFSGKTEGTLYLTLTKETIYKQVSYGVYKTLSSLGLTKPSSLAESVSLQYCFQWPNAWRRMPLSHTNITKEQYQDLPYVKQKNDNDRDEYNNYPKPSKVDAINDSCYYHWYTMVTANNITAKQYAQLDNVYERNTIFVSQVKNGISQQEAINNEFYYNTIYTELNYIPDKSIVVNRYFFKKQNGNFDRVSESDFSDNLTIYEENRKYYQYSTKPTYEENKYFQKQVYSLILPRPTTITDEHYVIDTGGEPIKASGTSSALAVYKLSSDTEIKSGDYIYYKLITSADEYEQVTDEVYARQYSLVDGLDSEIYDNNVNTIYSLIATYSVVNNIVGVTSVKPTYTSAIANHYYFFDTTYKPVTAAACEYNSFGAENIHKHDKGHWFIEQNPDSNPTNEGLWEWNGNAMSVTSDTASQSNKTYYIQLSNFYNGYIDQPYKWRITLRQGEYGVDVKNMRSKWFDMLVTTGTVLGSVPDRIQGLYSDNIYMDYYIQLCSDTFDAINATDKDLATYVGNRVRISSYDHSYGYLYPQDGFIEDEDIEKAKYFLVYKWANDPDYIETNRIADYATTTNIDEVKYNGYKPISNFQKKSEYSSYYTQKYVGKISSNDVTWNLYDTGASNIQLPIGSGVLLIKNQGDDYGSETYTGNALNGLYTISDLTVNEDDDEFNPLSSYIQIDKDHYGLSTTKTFTMIDAFPIIGVSITMIEDSTGTRVYDMDGDFTISSWSQSDNTVTVTVTVTAGQFQSEEEYYRVYIEATTTTTTTTTITWQRAAYADEWADFLNKAYYIKGGTYATRNFETNATAGGVIDTTPVEFILEKPIMIYPTPDDKYIDEYGENVTLEQRKYFSPVFKNSNTRTFIRPFVGITEGMKFQYGQNEGEAVFIDTIDNKIWCITHEALPYNLILSSNETTYRILSYFKLSDENPFYAYSKPEVLIYIQNQAEYLGNGGLPIIADRYAICSAVYSQDENISWKNYQWSLYNDSDGYQIYTGDVQYGKDFEQKFVGLEAEKYYTVSFTIENNVGVSLTVARQFQVQVDLDKNTFPVDIEFDCKLQSVKFSFAQDANILPIPLFDETLNYDTPTSETNNSLTISDNISGREFGVEYNTVSLKNSTTYDYLQDIKGNNEITINSQHNLGTYYEGNILEVTIELPEDVLDVQTRRRVVLDAGTDVIMNEAGYTEANPERNQMKAHFYYEEYNGEWTPNEIYSTSEDVEFINGPDETNNKIWRRNKPVVFSMAKPNATASENCDYIFTEKAYVSQSNPTVTSNSDYLGSTIIEFTDIDNEYNLTNSKYNCGSSNLGNYTVNNVIINSSPFQTNVGSTSTNYGIWFNSAVHSKLQHDGTYILTMPQKQYAYWSNKTSDNNVLYWCNNHKNYDFYEQVDINADKNHSGRQELENLTLTFNTGIKNYNPITENNNGENTEERFSQCFLKTEE